MKTEPNHKEYNEYVEQITPKHNLCKTCIYAFLIGGVICTLGQCLMQWSTNMWQFSKEDAATFVTITLVFFSVLLTGLNWYPSIVKVGGAGALVPITGFANSVAAPCIEFQKEGQVFGIGVKVFTIAGPVILYGVFTSFVLGLIFMILQKVGLA